MKKILIITAAVFMTLFGFARDLEPNVNTKPLSVETAGQEGHHWTCAMPIVDPESEDEYGNKAIVTRSYLWPVGSVIKVKFMEVNPIRQIDATIAALTWQKYANVWFEFVTSGNADIRISFDSNDGSWSKVGTDALNHGQSVATMNLGWNGLDVALHEFGHALGMRHEHQSPTANISWDEQYVIDYCYNNWGWSETTTRHNILNQKSASQSNYSAYDDQSIMIYAFPSSWTTNGYSTSTATTLSATDKSFMRSQGQYPFTATMVGAIYPQWTDGDYETVGEYNNAPVFQKQGGSYTWSIYKRANGKWYLDFNAISEAWDGTVAWSNHTGELPFDGAWGNGGACAGRNNISMTGTPYATWTVGDYDMVGEYNGYPVYERQYNGRTHVVYRRADGKWYLDFNDISELWNGTIAYTNSQAASPWGASWNGSSDCLPN